MTSPIKKLAERVLELEKVYPFDDNESREIAYELRSAAPKLARIVLEMEKAIIDLKLLFESQGFIFTENEVIEKCRAIAEEE